MAITLQRGEGEVLEINRRTKVPSTKGDSWIPMGLIALSLVPALAGAVRILKLEGAVPITDEDARVLVAPVPLVVHIISVMIFSLVGAFQFQPSFRRRHPRWHRYAGRVLVLCGLLTALTGLWMQHRYAPGPLDGPLLYAMRLLVGLAMILCIFFGLAAIRQRNFIDHSAWMVRCYALGLGAGTQVFTHLPWILFPSIHGELTRALCMGAGWVMNAVVAEWVIRQMRGPIPTSLAATT